MTAEQKLGRARLLDASAIVFYLALLILGFASNGNRAMQNFLNETAWGVVILVGLLIASFASFIFARVVKGAPTVFGWIWIALFVLAFVGGFVLFTFVTRT